MIDDDNDGQIIFGDLGGLKLPEIFLTGEENPEKPHPGNLPDRGSNPGPLRDKCACYPLFHSGGQEIRTYPQKSLKRLSQESGVSVPSEHR